MGRVLKFISTGPFWIATLSWSAVVFLWLFPKPPGYAIGALAGATALMTFVTPSNWHKAMFIGAIAFLLVLELHSIESDRAAQEQKYQEDKRDLHVEFQKILLDSNDKFAAILAKYHEEFNILTGGDSWAYATILDTSDPSIVNLQVFNRSKQYTVRNVRMMLVDVDAGYLRHQVFIGDIAPGKGVTPDVGIKPSPIRKSTYTLFFETDGRSTFENLYIEKTSAGWKAHGDVNEIKGDKKITLVRF